MSGNCTDAGIRETLRLGLFTKPETALCTRWVFVVVSVLESSCWASKLTAGPSEATKGSEDSTAGFCDRAVSLDIS